MEEHLRFVACLIDGDFQVPANSTIHAVLCRHGRVTALGRRRPRAQGTELSPGLASRRPASSRLITACGSSASGATISAHRSGAQSHPSPVPAAEQHGQGVRQNLEA